MGGDVLDGPHVLIRALLKTMSIPFSLTCTSLGAPTMIQIKRIRKQYQGTIFQVNLSSLMFCPKIALQSHYLTLNQQGIKKPSWIRKAPLPDQGKTCQMPKVLAIATYSHSHSVSSSKDSSTPVSKFPVLPSLHST